MKKYTSKILVLGLMIIFTVGKSYSQQYVPFPTSNAAWHTFALNCNEFHYSVNGDTVINNNTYHRLFATIKHYNSNWRGCGSYLIGISYSNYMGAYRNDSLNKLVYYVPSGSTSDTILYDFNLSVGDTLREHYKYNPSATSSPISVVRIDTVNYGGVARKKYSLIGCVWSSPDTISIIEGIGSSFDLLSQYIECPGLSLIESLSCMNYNGQRIYPYQSSSPCNIIVSTKNVLVETKLLPMPNPTTGQVNIPAIEGLASIELYDIQGSLVHTSTPLSMTSSENITVFQITGKAGIYLLRLIMEDGSVSSTKIVKN